MYSPRDVRLLLHTVQRGQSVEKRTHVALSLLSGGGILGNGPNPSCCSFCFYYVLLSHVIRHSSTREKKGTFFCVSVRYIFSIYTLSLASRVHVVNFFMDRYLLLGYITSDCTSIVRFSPVCVYMCVSVFGRYI